MYRECLYRKLYKISTQDRAGQSPPDRTMCLVDTQPSRRSDARRIWPADASQSKSGQMPTPARQRLTYLREDCSQTMTFISHEPYPPPEKTVHRPSRLPQTSSTLYPIRTKPLPCLSQPRSSLASCPDLVLHSHELCSSCIILLLPADWLQSMKPKSTPTGVCEWTGCPSTYRYSSLRLLRNHVRHVHDKKPIVCDDRNRVFSSPQCLRQHNVAIQDPTSRILCGRGCGARLNGEYGLSMHEKYNCNARTQADIDAIANVECGMKEGDSLCTKEFQAKSQLKTHQNLHFRCRGYNTTLGVATAGSGGGSKGNLVNEHYDSCAEAQALEPPGRRHHCFECAAGGEMHYCDAPNCTHLISMTWNMEKHTKSHRWCHRCDDLLPIPRGFTAGLFNVMDKGFNTNRVVLQIEHQRVCTGASRMQKAQATGALAEFDVLRNGNGKIYVRLLHR